GLPRGAPTGPPGSARAGGRDAAGPRRARSGALLGALRLAGADLVGEEGEGERTRRLVGVDPLAVGLAALDEQLAVAPEVRPPPQPNRHGLRSDSAIERL